MTLLQSLPRPIQPFVQFSQVLRTHGFAVSPEQSSSFIEAIGLLGPRDLTDIRNAGLAMFAIPYERRSEYDALFRALFLGQTVSAPVTSDEDDDETQAYDEREGEQQIDVEDDEQEVGGEVSSNEVLSHREFSQTDDQTTLRQFKRQVARALPRRRAYRRRQVRSGTAFDLRRSLREAVKRDGEIFELKETKRKTRQRPIVVLIDVSGSMQDQTESALRFSHALKTAAERVEVFTFGTRLTRITRSLSDRNEERALEKVGGLVADFDGGTRIGDALDALLAVPRFAGLLRGAAVIVLSDGLERGDPSLMIDAVRRLSRMAWRLDWLSPLAGEEGFVPQTEALSAVLPWLDSLSKGGDISALCTHVMHMAEHNRFQSHWRAA